MSESPDTATSSPARNRLRFELIFASAWIGFGLLILPALIYWIGTLMLGPYGENAGLGTFYLDYFRDLAEPTGRAWSLLAGPLATISLLRLIFGKSRKVAADESESPSPAPPPAAPRRVEPRLGSD